MKFKHGDICYTIDGCEVEYIASLGNGYAVREIIECDEDESGIGNLIEVREVFENPPHHKYNTEIATLKKEIESLRASKSSLERECRIAKENEAERKSRIMQNAALERIDNFLLGKFTHFVFYRYGVKVMSFDEAIRYKESEYDRVPKGMKLLSLFGKTNGNLEWQLSRYSDGSGSPDEVIPCSSLEDAKNIAKEKIDGFYDAWRLDKRNDYYMTSAAESAQKLGFEVPPDIAAHIKAKAIEELLKQVESAEKSFNEAKAKLEAVRGGEN
jgi:hypothetical protein